jgi:hypothetical protein
LLGNNLIGDEGARVIADYIRSGCSRITVWYIAGNRLTSTGIEPIAEALKNDKLHCGSNAIRSKRLA